MRFVTTVASSAALALAAFGLAAPAMAQETAAPAAAPAPATGEPTDAELALYASTLEKVRAVTSSGAAPTPEQQSQMAELVQNSGLGVERFNAISTAVSGSEVLQARVAVAAATPSAPGSVGASVTDAETEQYAKALAAINSVAGSLNGAAPTDEQQAQMASAITDTGLEVDRFNAISQAMSSDSHLRARIELAGTRLGE